MTKRQGRYSGNERLDPKEHGFEEPDSDNQYTMNMWLMDGEVQSDPDFHRETSEKVDFWKNKVKKASNIDPEKIVVHTVGESHIDCAWLWRYEQTREKAYKTFKKACDHADLFPKSFNFALSEPLLLEWVKEDHPDLFTRIQEKVKSGNIELVGGSYVEPDCMMPSGEAFCRMRLYGMRFLRDNFGILPKVEWFLDSFGYNWGIPQILVKSGAKYFWTSKITWNYDTTFPFVNFWWQSPDGSRLLTANFHMGTGSLDDWAKYEVGRRPLKANGQKVWSYLDDYSKLKDHVEMKELCPHVGNFFGRGDGGHGPMSQEVAVQNEYTKISMFKWSRVHTFYEELEKWSDRFPVWNDELYLENHRGTFSVHAEVKRHNRKNENALTSHESFALMANLINPAYKYPFDTFEWGWKTTLKNQFHDVLPGSSIPEVYDDAWDDWCAQEESYEKIERDIGIALSGTNKSKSNKASENIAEIFLYNPVPWERVNRVFIPVTVFKQKPKLNQNGKPNYAKLVAMDTNAEYICQPIAAEPENAIERMPAGWYAVPKLGGTTNTAFHLKILDDATSAELEHKESISITNSHISNGLVSVKIDSKTGAILEITSDKINGGKNLMKGNQSNLTFAWEDHSKQWPAWNLEGYQDFPLKVDQSKNISITIEEKGPVFATLNITKTILESQVTQKISLFKDCSEVFLEYLTDWKTPQRILKVLYSTSTHAEFSVADIAYGAIKRKTKPNTPGDKARYEKTMHKYVDLSTPENTWGLAIINEGKYAYDTEVDNESVRLTMLRSPEYPGPAGEAWVLKERIYNKEKLNHEVPKYSALTPFKCRYALLPHEGGTLIKSDCSANSIVKRKAEEFNQPVLIAPSENIEKGNASFKLLEIKTPNVFLGALKSNEWDKNGNIIARFVEGCGIPSTKAEISFNSVMAAKIKSIKVVDILERELPTSFQWDKSTGTLKFDIGKFEIYTFEFVL